MTHISFFVTLSAKNTHKPAHTVVKTGLKLFLL